MGRAAEKRWEGTAVQRTWYPAPRTSWDVNSVPHRSMLDTSAAAMRTASAATMRFLGVRPVGSEPLTSFATVQYTLGSAENRAIVYRRNAFDAASPFL